MRPPQCDGSLRDENRLLKFGPCSQDVAQIEQRRCELGMIGTELYFLEANRALCETQGLFGRSAAVQNKHFHQQVQSTRHLRRRFTESTSELVDAATCRRLGLDVHTF